jgi:biofilm PGA synthesis N-glycosyltransferase PgaC
VKWVFWLSVVLITYAYVGYAGWLWLQSQIRSRPVLRSQQHPAISIVMVVRNEEAWIELKLRNLIAINYPHFRCQVVVVSDGSTDRTEAILREHSRDRRLSLVMNQLSGGKASGLNDAIPMTDGEIVVFTDVRQQIEAGAIALMMENFADPEVGCVSGALMLGDPTSGEVGKGMNLYWRTEKKIRELESKTGSVVGATGAFYAVRRELVPELPAGTILDDVYIPMQVVRRKKRVIFDGRARAWDVGNASGGWEFARKVRTLSGNYQLLQLMPWILSGRNPLFVRFVSHKLFRLVVPFALAAMLTASILLSTPFYRVALALQLAFYVLGLIALVRLPKRGVLARASDAAGTFMVLNTAAVIAFVNFVLGRKIAWSR